MMCEACERDDHANCGMQTWCECDCDPELAVICEGEWLAMHEDMAARQLRERVNK